MNHKFITWLLFAAAVLMSLGSMVIVQSHWGVGGNSAGGAAAGLWIAFALLYLRGMKPPAV